MPWRGEPSFKPVSFGDPWNQVGLKNSFITFLVFSLNLAWIFGQGNFEARTWLTKFDGIYSLSSLNTKNIKMSFYESNENRGFNFSNFKRNKYILEEAGANPPKYKKTGTTIVGVVCKDGVALATDTRATGGSLVMEKLCQKLHHMAPNIYCAGAGTAADCDKVTGKSF